MGGQSQCQEEEAFKMKFNKATEQNIEDILFEPSVFAQFCNDYSPIYETAKAEDYAEYDIYCNEDEDILFFVKENAPHIFEVHSASLKRARGRKVFKAYREFKSFIKDVLGGTELLLTVPSGNRPAQVAAVQAAGGQRVLVLKNAIVKNRFFLDMYIYKVIL